MCPFSPVVHLKTLDYVQALLSSFKQQLSFLIQNIPHSIFLINALSLDKFSTVKQSESDPISQNPLTREKCIRHSYELNLTVSHVLNRPQRHTE